MNIQTMVFLICLIIAITVVLCIPKAKKIAVNIHRETDEDWPQNPDERGVFRKVNPDHNGMWNSSPYHYFCKCGTKLTEGPEGAASINAVCKACRINYGCLPGYYGDGT